MQNVDGLDGNEFPPPEILARQIRSSYAVYFGAPAICLVAAVLFAIGHEWLYSAGNAVAALIYFPVSLLQYRNSKKICEDAIRNYQQWYQENGTNASQ